MHSELARDVACVILLIVLAIGFFWQAAFSGKVLLGADLLMIMTPWKDYGREHFPDFHEVETPLIDPVILFYPWRAQAKQTIAEGQLPLWNPDLLCGTPLAANSSSAVWYPPNVLFYILSLPTAWTWCIILHFAMAGCFMFLFLRGIGANRAGAMVGSVAWMFNGWHVAWAEYQTIVCVLVWLPLVLLCAERALARARYGWAVAGGVAWAMQLLAGHAQYALFAALLIGCYCVARIVSLRRDPDPPAHALRHRIGVCVLMGAVACSVGAIQVLPTAELARVNHRRGAFDYSTVHAGALPAKQVGMLFAPNLCGAYAEHEWIRHPYVGAENWLEYSAYVGVAPLLLAIVGVFALRRWHARFFAVFAALVLLTALGTPLMWLFYHVLPGATQMPSIPRILSLWTFCIAVLSGLCASRLGALSDWVSERSWRRVLTDLLPICLILVFVVWLSPKEHPWVTEGMMDPVAWSGFVLTQIAIVFLLFLVWRTLVRLAGPDRGAICAWLLAAVTVVDLFGFFCGWNPAKDRAMLYPETEAIREARGLAGDAGRVVSLPAAGEDAFLSDVVPNIGLLFGFREVQGADSLFYKRTKEFWNTVRYGHPEDPKAAVPNEVRFSGPPPADLLTWLRVKCVLTPRDDLGSGDGLRCIRRVGGMTLYAPDPPSDADSEWTTMARAIVGWDTPGANAHEFRVDRDTDGEMALPVTFYPGWRATVDGTQVPLHPAKHAFCGVHIPVGAHTIRLDYRPASFRVGAFLTLVGIAIVAASAAAAIVFSSRFPRQRSGGRSSR